MNMDTNVTLPSGYSSLYIALLWNAGNDEAVKGILQQLVRDLLEKDRRNISATLRRAIQDIDDVEGELGETISNVAQSVSAGYLSSQSLRELDVAIEIGELAVRETPEHWPGRPGILINLGLTIHRRYERTGNVADLDSSLAKVELGVSIMTDLYPYQSFAHFNLGNLLFDKYKRDKQMDGLERAISNIEVAVALTSTEHPDQLRWLTSLVPMLLQRYERAQDKDDLTRAFKTARMVVDNTPKTHPALPRRRAALAAALSTKYEDTDGIAELDESVSWLKMAISITPEDDADLPTMLGNLGSMLATRYTRTDSTQDLEEAILNTTRAISMFLEGDPGCSTWLSNLSGMRLEKYKLSSNMNDLQAALEGAQQAVSASFEDQVRLPHILNNLADIQEKRYQQTWNLADLESAIETSARACSLTSGDDPSEAHVFEGLGQRFFQLYERNGEMDDLETAIANVQISLEVTAKGPSARSQSATFLGDLLCRRYERTGNMDDLDTSIRIGEEAIRATPPDHADRARCLSNYSNKLRYRYERTRSTEDLEAAVWNAQEAVKATRLDHPKHPGWLNNAGISLYLRYQRTMNLNDLEDAIKCETEAVSKSPKDNPERLGFLNNLGPMLLSRYDATKRIDDLDMAISSAEQAVSLAPEDLPERAKWLSNLGTMLSTRYKHTGNRNDLTAAMLNQQMAVRATPKDHPDRASWLFNLGNTLNSKFLLSFSFSDLDEPLKCYKEAFECLNSPPLHRVMAARIALRVLQLRGEWDKANSLAQKAIELVPLVCNRSLNREDQQHAVLQTSGLAADSCSLSLKAGDAEKALKQLEFGRGLVLGYLIDSRSDLSALGDVSDDLAKRYSDLRHTVSRPIEASDPAMRERMIQERREAAKALDDCLDEIRKKDGLKTFLLEPSTEELKSVASEGPIVVINATDIGADAIIVTDTDDKPIDSIPLPNLSASMAPLRLQRAFEQYKEIDKTSRCSKRDMESESELIQDSNVEVLSWLWSSCVSVVLAELRKKQPSMADMSCLPRIWWVGAGVASSLPFHAAGQHYKNSRENTLSQCIPSYTPTIKALTFSRSCAGKATNANCKKTKVLLVTMPETPGQNPLYGVNRERSAIEEVVRGVYETETFEHRAANEVLEAIKEVEIAHFACHGSSDGIDPSNSHLLLRKKGVIPPSVDKLTVSQISNENTLGQARIAYLSACSTAQTRAEGFADESLHLASAFQVAGFGHVIGSLWAADDDTCVQVARHFYTYLTSHSDAKDANRMVAEALRHAVLQVCLEFSADPVRWAPYIHSGA